MLRAFKWAQEGITMPLGLLSETAKETPFFTQDCDGSFLAFCPSRPYPQPVRVERLIWIKSEQLVT